MRRACLRSVETRVRQTLQGSVSIVLRCMHLVKSGEVPAIGHTSSPLLSVFQAVNVYTVAT